MEEEETRIHEVRLEPVEYRVLTLLLSGQTTKQIETETGVSERTIKRWKCRQDFQELLYQGCIQAYEAAIAVLVAESQHASQQLVSLIHHDRTPYKVRLNAIELCLKYAEKSREFMLRERLSKIEQMLNGGISTPMNLIKKIEYLQSNFEDDIEEDVSDEHAE